MQRSLISVKIRRNQKNASISGMIGFNARVNYVTLLVRKKLRKGTNTKSVNV